MSGRASSPPGQGDAASAPLPHAQGAGAAGTTPVSGGRTLLTRRNLIYGLAMMATAVVAQVREPRQIYPNYTEEAFAAQFPKTIGQWTAVSNEGLVLPPPDELSRKLYQNLLTRIYRNPSGAHIMVLLAYANRQEGNIQAHRPDICYPSAGFEILSNREHVLRLGDGRLIPGRTLEAQRSNRVETLFYWVRVDRKFPVVWRDQRLAMAEANVMGDVPDGIIVRFSVLEEGPQALALLEDFARQFVDRSTVKGRRILLGRGPNETVVR